MFVALPGSISYGFVIETAILSLWHTKKMISSWSGKVWNLFRRTGLWTLIIALAIIFLLIIQGHHGLGDPNTFESSSSNNNSSDD